MKFMLPDFISVMKKYLLIIGLLYGLKSMAQSREWMTGVPDTSFNIEKDYHKNLKQYPFIKIVPDSTTGAVNEVRNLVYCRLGSRKLHIDAFTPAGKKKILTPAVIIVHGGGWRSGNHTQHIPLAQHLAALGYASFTVEYRLSTEALYPAAVNDIKSAIQWVRANAKKFNIDTNKIVILGFSAGGQLAALVGITSGMDKFDAHTCNKGNSSSVQAVVDIDGTLSFVSPDAWETQNVQTVASSTWWIGYKRTERLEVWTEASPLTYADRNKIPFLFLNSAVERMHAGRDVFKEMMDKKAVYTQIVDFKDTPHTFCLYRPWFDPMVKDIDLFLTKIFK
jgi:acetyl esterase/lipase